MISKLALRRTSLIDFPDCVSAVAFLPGCSLRCPYCHNAAIVDPRLGDAEWASTGEFLGFLDSRKGKLDGIVFSGGEPCLNEDLPRLVEAVRKRGMRVKLDTNGMHPDALLPLVESGVDYVAMDVKTSPENYRLLGPLVDAPGEKLEKSMRLLRSLPVRYEFRVTCAPGLVDQRVAAEMAALFEEGDAVFLQEFVAGPTLDPAWSELPPLGKEALHACLEAIRAKAPKARIRGE